MESYWAGAEHKARDGRSEDHVRGERVGADVDLHLSRAEAAGVVDVVGEADAAGAVGAVPKGDAEPVYALEASMVHLQQAEAQEALAQEPEEARLVEARPKGSFLARFSYTSGSTGICCTRR